MEVRERASHLHVAVEDERRLQLRLELAEVELLAILVGHDLVAPQPEACDHLAVDAVVPRVRLARLGAGSVRAKAVRRRSDGGIGRRAKGARGGGQEVREQAAVRRRPKGAEGAEIAPGGARGPRRRSRPSPPCPPAAVELLVVRDGHGRAWRGMEGHGGGGARTCAWQRYARFSFSFVSGCASSPVPQPSGRSCTDSSGSVSSSVSPSSYAAVNVACSLTR